MEGWFNLAQAIAPLILGITAFYLGGANERKRDMRTLEREDIARKEMRRETVENQRHAFQQETLLSLQESLLEIARFCARTLIADREHIIETGKFGMLPEEVGGVEAMEASANFSRLANRILDDDLRAELLRLKDILAGMSLPPQNFDALTAVEVQAMVGGRFSDLQSTVDDVQNSLGIALRIELARA